MALSTVKQLGILALALSASTSIVAQQFGGPLPRQESGTLFLTGQQGQLPLVCEFPIRIDQAGGAQIIFFPGKGFHLYMIVGDSGNTQFTNLNTGESFLLQSRGGTFSEVSNGDGTTTLTMTGTFVNAWFPTDTPSQTTILYKGRVRVLRTNTSEGDILQSAVGTQTDICALIS